MKTIHINNEEFKYRVGRSHVVIRLPNGKTLIGNFSDVSLWTWPDIERGQWKRYFAIKPAAVKKFILKKVFGIMEIVNYSDCLKDPT